ncbi:MAG: M48 family metallopeptidase [Elusimicrobia bacterium]|nr:M48 family metallopeptidase [Elusimicrobiota bacterium]MBU2614230.1 M48 family metallopeptidase [Elusimicrobiota bacterium]
MNIYLIIILAILIGNYLLNLVVETLNVKHISTVLPEEFAGHYSQDKYKISQTYLKENTNFDLIADSFNLVIVLMFILAGGFNCIDNFARGFGFNSIFTGLIFAGVVMFASEIISIPFTAYHTFVIEEKFGFNKTTIKTFILDHLKEWLLTGIIGGIVFALVLWFFAKTGSSAWIYCWVLVTVVYLFLAFIAPVVIMPLFNKFIPLEEGELKTAIENFAKEQNFKLSGLFKMDASKRSTKSNAYFTGFGKYRRIVLFDTLIQKHTVDELVSVLAHEIGHYKKKHIFKSLIITIFTTGLMFFILSLFLNNQQLFAAFKMANISIYASLFFFGFLFTPINLILSILGNILSRKHEYEADRFAVSAYNKPESMTAALKKLSVDNLSNLTPHPLKVFLEYSHPPILQRIEAIKKI